MPLKGIKVIELAGLAPGPLCGMILADFGATVTRIDKITQSILPDPLGNGKRSIAIDLKSQNGRNIFKRISDKSDVIIDTYRAGVMEKLKLGPKELMDTNKKLIYARLTGFGQDGLYSKMSGHDINYLALSGLLSLFGRKNEKPTPPVNFAADFAGGGLTCALGILLALYERTKSCKGQVIDASMVHGSAYLGSWFYLSQKIPGLWGQPRGNNLLDTGTHFYETYETKDEKYMAVGALEPQFYSEFLKKLNIAEDELPQFENFEENKLILSNIFKSKNQEEWCQIFDGSDACVTPVLSLQSAPHHVHNNAQNFFTKTKLDSIVPTPAPKLSRTPGFPKSIIDSDLKPGQHTVNILLENDYSPDEVEHFIKDGIVVQSFTKSKF